MDVATDYFKLFQKNESANCRIINPKLFIATDDPNIITEIRWKYPEYEVINEKRPESKISKSDRHLEPHLESLIRDIYTLVHLKYFVGTLSSNISKLVYELRLFLNGEEDPSKTSNSVDCEWHHFNMVSMIPYLGRIQDEHTIHFHQNGYLKVKINSGEKFFIPGNIVDSESNNRRMLGFKENGKLGYTYYYQIQTDESAIIAQRSIFHHFHQQNQNTTKKDEL